MANQISKSKFKGRALEYCRQVQKTGKEIVLTEHGRPVLKLVPYIEGTRATMEKLRNSVLLYNDPPEPVGPEDWAALKW
jgi:prevent-host-death family protein